MRGHITPTHHGPVAKTIEASAQPVRRNGKAASATPIRETGVFVADSGDKRNWINRLLIGTASRGMVHIKWHAATRSVVIPANWSCGWYTEILDEFYPVQFTVAHAQNAIVKFFVENDYEWLLLLEDDVMPPPDLYIRLDGYLRDGPPVVSGLYYQKAFPSEPLVYRGRGNGAYTDWKPGQKVWCDGVPTGCLLIHQSILKIMYEESPQYTVGDPPQVLREVFVSPMRIITDEQGNLSTSTGTSDLEWCNRVIREDVLKRAGWPKIARKRFPYLVDTAIFCKHIAPDGTIFPG